MTTRARELVELRAPIVVRLAPLRLDPAAPFEAMEGRIERSLRNLERRRGDLADALRDRPAVLRLEGQRFQDEQIERPLRELDLRCVHGFGHATPCWLLQERVARAL